MHSGHSRVDPDPVPAHAVPPRTPRPTPAPVARSPRLDRLAREVVVRGDRAVEEFWREVSVAGSPLIEDAGHAGHVIATFVWRDRGRTRAVLALVNKLTDRTDLAASLMRPLAGTDVWALSYLLPDDWRGSYHLAPDDRITPMPRQLDTASGEYLRRLAREATLADPFNERHLPQPEEHAPKSIAELPAAPAQPYVAPRTGVPAGMVEECDVRSDILNNHRRIWVYTPHGYPHARERYPLLVLLDGDIWCESLPIAPTLDNLIAQGAIPPTITVAIDSLGRDTRSRELPCYEPFVHFLTTELIPGVAARWRITDDPAHTIIAGQSLGGLAAIYAAHRAPARFGNALTQSGSFWWGGPDSDQEVEWFTRCHPRSAHLPVRFYVEVGTDEWVSLPPTRRLRTALREMGYEVHYREFNGGHDRACWRGGIADGLVTLAHGW